MKSNILIVGLNYDFTKRVAKELSNYFDMYFLDVGGLIEYSLMDIKKMQIVCGIEYYEKEKTKIIKSLAQYENTVISIQHNLLLEGETLSIVNSTALVIYLGMSKSLIKKENERNGNLSTEVIAYAEINNLLKIKSDINVECDSLSETSALEKILSKLKQL